MSLDVPELDVELPTAKLDINGIDPHKPIIDPPDMGISLLDMELPEVGMPMLMLATWVMS